MRMQRRTGFLLWLFAVVVGMALHAPIASAVVTTYRSAVIFGTAATWNGATFGSGNAPQGLYWNSGDGLPHVRKADGTEYAIPNAAVSGSGGYATVDNQGTPLTQRNTTNFTGSGVSCVDNPGSARTECSISKCPPGVVCVTEPPYNADPTGVSDSTSGIQAAINAAVTLAGGVAGLSGGTGGTVFFPSGTYKSGLVTDTSSSAIEFVGSKATIISSTASTWLKVTPPVAGKYGFKMSGFTINPASGNVAMTPLVWLNGGGANGGVVYVEIDDLKFNATPNVPANPTYFDCLGLYGVFSGRVANIWGQNLFGSRGIVYNDNGVQSGNVHFDSITLFDSPVPFVLNGTAGSVNVQVSNLKAVRYGGYGAPITDYAPYNTVTLTASGTSGNSNITVSPTDATTINTALTAHNAQWIVLADSTNGFDQVNLITAANTSTGVLTLQQPLGHNLSNGTVLGVGVFGSVIAMRNATFAVPHYEVYGVGAYVTNSAHVEIDSATVGSNLKRGVVVTNSSTHVKVRYPTFINADTALTLMEITAQPAAGNSFNSLVEPVGSGGGGPIASVYTDSNGTDNGLGNVYRQSWDSNIPRTVTLNPLDATAGNRPVPVQLGELVRYATDGLLYICTSTGTPSWTQFVTIDGTQTITNKTFSGTTQVTGTTADIAYSGSSVNRLRLGSAGSAAPTFTTYSAGMKLLLFDNVGGASVGYALGVEGSNMWLATQSTATGFKFYGGQTLASQLSGTGILTHAVGSALASATTIAPTQRIHHITGTTTLQTITPPSMCATSTMGCEEIFIFDGVAPWNAAGNITVAGTPTTVGTSVIFTYDNATSKWSPSRTL